MWFCFAADARKPASWLTGIGVRPPSGRWLILAAFLRRAGLKVRRKGLISPK